MGVIREKKRGFPNGASQDQFQDSPFEIRENVGHMGWSCVHNSFLLPEFKPMSMTSWGRKAVQKK